MRQFKGKKDCIVYDSNANCAGMTIAVEQASRYLLSDPHINNALVVGSDYLSLVANPDEEITYASFGDAAAAVFLEKRKKIQGLSMQFTKRILLLKKIFYIQIKVFLNMY